MSFVESPRLLSYNITMVEKGRSPQAEYFMPKDQTPDKEAYQILFDGITISGYSGVGKTKLGEILAKRYDLEFIKVGQMLREEMKKKGKDVVGYAERNGTQLDELIDKKTADRIRSAKHRKKKFLIEARLGGWIAKKVQDEMKRRKQKSPKPREDPPVVFKILLTAGDVRFSRIQKRENERVDGENIKRTFLNTLGQKANLPYMPYQEQMTLDETTKQTVDREYKDLTQAWRPVHSEMNAFHPFDEKNKDEKGEPIYDMIVPTDNLSVEEVADVIHGALVFKGLVKRLPERRGTPRLPAVGQVFPTELLKPKPPGVF